MSFITMLGGAEADRVNQISDLVNDLISKMQELESMIFELDERLDNISEILIKKTEELEKTDKNLNDFLENKVMRYTNESLGRRVEELERMQRYFQSSHGRALNDIQDLKKELYNLYGRQTPPPAKERAKSQDPNPEKKELLELVRESDYTDFRKQRLINTLTENGLTTFESVKSMTFDDLCEIKGLGPASAMLLINLRKQYTGVVDPLKKIRLDIPAWDMRSVIMDMNNIPMKQKTRIINALYQRGINNLKDLETTRIEEFEKIPHLGKASMKVMRDIYQNYVWA